MKKVNYQIGVLKRKFKLGKGDQPPGTFIRKAQEANKTITQTVPANPIERIAVDGMV
jgi:hypothetical protein